MTNIELAKKALDVAQNYKTMYIYGCFGAPMMDKNKKRYANKKGNAGRAEAIYAADRDCFGFDCCGLIKGLGNGWCGDINRVYGGASYGSVVPDIGANTMIKRCADVTGDFSYEPEVGEAVWCEGHIGIYVGGGMVVEATAKWESKVLITSCHCDIEGLHRRDWTLHGKMPYFDYIVPLRVGDRVMLTPDAVTYKGGRRFSSWVYKKKLYVRKISGDRVYFSIYRNIGYTGSTKASMLVKI